MYQPSIAVGPRDWMLPNDPRRTKHQHRTNACTGFALSTAIEYLLDRGQRPCEPISGYMLYSLARTYDEWAEDDDVDTGSTLRGDPQGRAGHDASADRLGTEKSEERQVGREAYRTGENEW